MNSRPAPAERAEWLKSELWRHRRLYYLEASPEISDAEYDRLEAELRQIESAHPELVSSDSPTRRVGFPVEGDFAKAEHSEAMLSLENVYTAEELEEWESRLRRAAGLEDDELIEYSVEHKIDGVSVAVTFRGGELWRAVSRGDGHVGEDITANIRTIRSLPLRLGAGISGLEARGEVYFPRGAFEALNDHRRAAGETPFANPRNAAAGTLRLQDPETVAARPLALQFWQAARIEDEVVTSHAEALRVLERAGLITSRSHRLVSGLSEVMAYIDEWESNRAELDYEIDGVVIKADRFDLQSRAGSTARAPRWAIAWKYAAEQATTRLTGVTIQVGRTGVLTPVAELEAVFLAGSTVSRATLHNFEEIARKDIRVGDLVVIEKGGEVIPKVVAPVLQQRDDKALAIEAPQTCPACGDAVEKESGEVAVRCVNPACPARLREALRHFASRAAMDIEGFGPALIDQLVERGLVRDMADLYQLEAGTLADLDRMGETSALKLVAQLAASRKRPLHRLLTALGIRHVGARAARVLARSYRTLDALVEESAREDAAERFAELDDIGPETAGALVSFLRSSSGRALLDRLRANGVDCVEGADEEADHESVFSGKTVVITGTLKHWTRSEAKQSLEAAGARVSSSVSSRTGFLLVGEGAGSKLEKARSLGVTIIDEEDAKKMLGASDG